MAGPSTGAAACGLLPTAHAVLSVLSRVVMLAVGLEPWWSRCGVGPDGVWGAVPKTARVQGGRGSFFHRLVLVLGLCKLLAGLRCGGFARGQIMRAQKRCFG